MRPLLGIGLADSIDEAARLGADLLVVRLRDATASAAIPSRNRVFVRLDAPDDDAAAAAAARMGAEGVLLADARSPAAIEQLSGRLAVAEARAGRPDGALRIIACVSGGEGLLALPDLAGASLRVGALGWDAAALAANLGAPSPREACDAWIEPLAHARTRLLAAAASAGLPAIDTPCSLAIDAFTAEAETAARHGFRAKFATTAAQAAAIRVITHAARG